MTKKRKKTRKELEQELEMTKLVNKAYVTGTVIAIGIIFGSALLNYFSVSEKHARKVNALKKQLQQANKLESRILKSKIVHLKRKIRKLTVKIK
jgi:hypothetical protein